MDDLRGVLGVDHLCTAGHGQHVVDEQWPQHQEGVAVGGLDDASLGQSDDLVVQEGPTVGVKLAARIEDHRVVTTLGVGQLDPVADDERTCPADVRFGGHSRTACLSQAGGRATRARPKSRLGAVAHPGAANRVTVDAHRGGVRIDHTGGHPLGDLVADPLQLVPEVIEGVAVEQR